MRARVNQGATMPASNLSEVLSEPSATFLQQLLARPAATAHQTRIAIFTGSAQTENRSTLQRTGTYTAPSSDLPFAVNEVKSIQAVFKPENTRLLTGDAATPEAIRAFPWEDYTIAHFATHALLNRQNMQLTGIVLNPSEKMSAGSGDAPMLWYGDICRMHSRLELVVLSACDTASGRDIPGEGLVGLSQAFFIAGSQRVLGTLWPVDDEATSMLMQYFYTYLQSTGSPGMALRLAQDKMSRNATWSAPYYWAGFSLAGDWRKLP
jgi:CHAT domain-containing protein